MKTFMLKYRKSKGLLESIREVDAANLNAARRERLELEFESLQRGGDLEIVLLTAASEETLRKTHSRYFKTTAQLGEAVVRRDGDGQSPGS